MSDRDFDASKTLWEELTSSYGRRAPYNSLSQDSEMDHHFDKRKELHAQDFYFSRVSRSHHGSTGANHLTTTCCRHCPQIYMDYCQYCPFIILLECVKVNIIIIINNACS